MPTDGTRKLMLRMAEEFDSIACKAEQESEGSAADEEAWT